MSAALITPEIRAAIGAEMPPLRLEISRNDIRKYAVATGQTEARYLDGDEAPLLLLFCATLLPIVPLDRLGPDGHPPGNPLLPELPLKRIMAGGSSYEVHGRIRAGDVLICRQKLVDISEKQGAEGPLIFLVFENRFETEAGAPVVVERLTRIAR